MVKNRYGAVLQDVQTLFDSGTIGALTDAELLGRFADRRDETAEPAFAALLERHGPMVFRVCRSVLRDDHDAQDAFQATFLILVRRAAAVRNREAVGSWLYGVALRVSARARAALARRRRHETRAAEMAPDRSTEERSRLELSAILHEELGRLPERYRAAVVLCYLEGQTCEAAARQLGWPVGTVKSRLARGRARLLARLIRRGLGPDESSGSSSAPAVMSAALTNNTAQAMLRFAAGRSTAGLASETALSWALTTLRTFQMTRFIMISTLLIAGLATTGAALLITQEPKSARPAVLAKAAAQERIQLRSTLKGHTSAVYCVAVSPNGKSVASGARDGVVICWDVATAQPKWTVKAHKDNGNGFTQVLSVAFSPDGKTLASGGWDCTVRLWDAASGDLKRTLTHENLVYSVAFSPDGKTLASGEHQTGVIHLWDIVTGKPTGTFAIGSGSVWSVAFSPDGKILASGGYVVRRAESGVVRLWDLSRRTLKLEIPAQTTGKVALSPDGRLVAGTGNQRRDGGHHGLVRLWDTRTGELQRTWTVAGDGRTSLGPVAFSPDGRLVAAGSMVGERARERNPGEIYLWNIEANRLVWKQTGHDDDVTGLAFTADGKTLVSGGRDKAVKLWEIR